MDYENTPHSSARRAPPMRAGLRTARDGSPPRTPIRYDSPRAAKGTGASQALRARSPSPRETFLDDITPVDNNRNAENEGSDRRDSHDLSLSPRQGARESLVDNMLLSFDQLPMFVPQHSIDEERHYYDDPSSPHTIFTRNGRQRGHTYSSSYSSEIDHADDSSSRYSKRPGHGRRSNSSSLNHQGSIGRIDSRRAEGARGKFFESQRASPASSRSHYGHSRGSKGSKGSTVGSTDLGYGQAVRGNPWTNDLHSPNPDNSYGKRTGYNLQLNMASNNLSEDERYQPIDYQDYEAAPTPTVPVGPRRRPQSPPPHSPPLQYATYPPQPSHPPPQTPHLERKRSTKSSKSLYNRAGRSDTLGAASTRTHTESFGDVSDPRELPPLPAFVNPPAPSPSVPFEKPTLPPQPPTKERQGFFRRVFGSSKNSSPQPSPLVQSENMSRAREQQHIVDQMIRPSAKQSPATPAENTPPLNKKHSFFRRRKKSFSENSPLPLPPLQVQQLQAVQTSDANLSGISPASSLRKVMDPYLTSPGGHVEEYQPYWRDDPRPIDSEETQSSDNPGRSPGHFSRDKPTIRAVARSQESLEGEQSARGEIDTAPAGTQAKASVGTNQAREVHEDSFLQDNSSGNECRTGKAALQRKPANLSYQEDERRPRTSPASPTYTNMAVQSEEERELRRMPAVKTILATSPDPASVVLPVSPPPRNGSTTEEPAGLNLLATSDRKSSNGSQTDPAERPWLAPASPADQPALSPQLSLPMEGSRSSQRASDSTNSDYKSASSIPVVQIDGEVSPSISGENVGEDECEPTAEDRDRAKKIYDGNEEIISKARAAAWLGESGTVSLRARKAYMGLYDWSNMNILAAMRALCGKLILKGETQQVDRIIDAFAHRWCECNPNHGFKHVDVVHTICYSLLLLNTDLHLADIDKKMTRNEFLKNTIPTVVRVASDAAPESFTQTSQNVSKRSSFLPPRSHTSHADHSTTDLRSPPIATFPRGAGEVKKEGRSSIDVDSGSRSQLDRTTALAQLSAPDDDPPPTPQHFDSNESGPLVKEPSHGTTKQWECQIEIVLKEFFNSIRQQRLPLHGASTERIDQQSNHNLSVFGQGQAMLRRSPSVLSKAPSESFVSTSRGRHEAPRPGTGRWNTKNRSRPRLYPSSNVGSSRTSLDDQSSIWSPSVSSTWSKYSLNKTQTSMSVDSFGSNFPQGDYQQSIGFANALSQAIIREEAPGSNSPLQEDSSPLLDSDQLELAGAPWAKEGILKHKHHLESIDKKAKNRNWTESFAVIERGWMRLFSFSSKSSKNRHQAGGVVGGGNWTENAEALGTFLLRQTIASALPPPGYSKARPHVWALSLPTGAVHLFQVGTPEIVREFVSTANYWSARLSKEPLVGGISNVEYGWSDMVINLAITNFDSHPSTPLHTRTRSTSTTGPQPRPSLQSSIRSSMEQGSVKPRLPGDRVMIADWSPPQQSMMASQLNEKDQLQALSTYVKNIEDELQKHNELRGAMLLALSPRHPNSAKAMANWERKSSYLLREIVKFRTYIDCLTAAQREKEKVLKGREDSATSAASTAAATEATTIE